MWSAQQLKAIDAVGNWLRNPQKPYFQLAGYAGTGKTTLAKHLAESVNGQVYFAAFTGKAAHVLMQSGIPDASTLHKLMYIPKGKSKQRLQQLEAQLIEAQNSGNLQGAKELKEQIKAEEANIARPSFTLNLDSPLKKAKLLVVDEYSMISKEMGQDIMSFGCPVLALGDPAQLPPVFGESYFSDKPDVLLTNIHRQAEGNPIIAMSQLVRNGQPLKVGSYGDSKVVRQDQIDRLELREAVLDCDQVLVGTNKTRINYNKRIRQLRGFTSPFPQNGDKLVCLRNNGEMGLLNGQLFTADSDSNEFDDNTVAFSIANEDGNNFGAVVAHSPYFLGDKPSPYDMDNAESFDYGYALTVHKAQGSQWGDVTLFDEWKNKTNRQQWLYTGLTRASQRITVVV